MHKVVLGAGIAFFPSLDGRIGLSLVETRTFDSGVVNLRYEVKQDEDRLTEAAA